MTNKGIVELYNGLTELKENKEMRFPARTTYAIVVNLKAIEHIVEAIVETKEAVLQRFGTEEQDNPGNYYIPPENRKDMIAEMEKIDMIENKVTFQYIQWEDIENLELSVSEMEALYPITIQGGD